MGVQCYICSPRRKSYQVLQLNKDRGLIRYFILELYDECGFGCTKSCFFNGLFHILSKKEGYAIFTHENFSS